MERGCEYIVNVQQMIEDNINLVYYVIHEYYPTFRQDEDVVQAGMVGLCYAANNWLEEKGSFSNYACLCVRSSIIKEFESRNKHKGVLSLDYEYSDSEGDKQTLADTFVGEEDITFIDVDIIRDKLSPKMKEIFDLRVSGWNNVQIAEKLGVSPQFIHKKVRRIRQIWRKVYDD